MTRNPCSPTPMAPYSSAGVTTTVLGLGRVPGPPLSKKCFHENTREHGLSSNGITQHTRQISYANTQFPLRLDTNKAPGPLAGYSRDVSSVALSKSTAIYTAHETIYRKNTQNRKCLRTSPPTFTNHTRPTDEMT